MADPSTIEPPEAARQERLLEHLFSDYIHDPMAPKPEEIQRLVAELIKHQAELEDQNLKLHETQKHLEAYRDRYIDLYDFAPLGYVTLDEEGYVQEINLAGANMLGMERDALTGYAFGEHVAKEDQNAFLEHLQKCVREHCDATSEFRLVLKGDQSIVVQLHSIPIEGPNADTLCKTAMTDITQRRNMEEAIQRSQAFLQTVIDAIPEPMLVIDRDYRIVLANHIARENAGRDVAVTCMACYQFSHHRDAPCEGQNEPCPLRQVAATKVPMTVMHTHYNTEGNEIFVEINAAPVFDKAGNVTHIIEACRDITARKRAEDGLAAERNLLRTLIDNLPDYIYVKDAELRFVAANLAAARIMGATTPNDLLGKNDYDFYPPDLADEYRADEAEILRSGQPLINKDEPHIDPGGNLRTVMTTKVPLKDSRGKIVGLVGISRDITERKRSEEDSRLSQFSIDHAGEAIFWVGSSAQIMYANVKACERLCYSHDELLLLTVHDIDPNYQAERWPQHWEELKQRGSLTFESQHLTRDGKLIPVEITCNYLEFEGREYNCCFVRDITDRKRCEEQARTAQQHVSGLRKEL